jgi:hypothetical protein
MPEYRRTISRYLEPVLLGQIRPAASAVKFEVKDRRYANIITSGFDTVFAVR